MQRLVLVIILAGALPVSAQTAVDGDKIEMGGTSYRLWGIDAPEMQQTCADGWPAGVEAKNALAELLRGRKVTCNPKTLDRYGRTVATCWADDLDVAASMVLGGQALASPRYTRDYVTHEAVARAAGRGVHGHGCEKPWDWRARHRSNQ